MEPGNAVAGLRVFSEGRGFQPDLVVSFEAPFECVGVSDCVRKRAGYVRSVGEQGSVGCMDLPSHSGLLSLSCHGDGGGSVLAQHCLSLHCFCCFQQLCRSSAAVAAVGDGVDVVFSATSPADYPVLRWIPLPLHCLLQLWL